jgi:hypothetical protein
MDFRMHGATIKVVNKVTSSVNLESSTQQQCVTNFVFLQFPGPRPWYGLWHNSNDFENKLTAFSFCFQVLRETGALWQPTLIITSGFTISTVSSLHFKKVNRYKFYDGISIQKVVWAMNDVAIYRCLTVINFNNFSNFLPLKYLAM